MTTVTYFIRLLIFTKSLPIVQSARTELLKPGSSTEQVCWAIVSFKVFLTPRAVLRELRWAANRPLYIPEKQSDNFPVRSLMPGGC